MKKLIFRVFYSRKQNISEKAGIIKSEEDMQEIVNDILKQHAELFGNHPKAKKINAGFTNDVYDVNNSFIIKICTDITNEEKFAKEIAFYKANKENNFIPKLHYSNTDKKDIPYFYEIIEKVEGDTLYNIWHTLNEREREKIIVQLCAAMKRIHSNNSEKYDWAQKIKNQFMTSYENATKLNIFSKEEQSLLERAYSKFDDFLESDDFVLVHNDLHFDNIIYKNGKIKIIDFERSMYGPRDFELDIIYRMIRKPWKFASEDSEQFVDADDYANIMFYIEKCYPELMCIPNLEQRLAIYDLVYSLRQLIEYPNLAELKADVLAAVRMVI